MPNLPTPPPPEPDNPLPPDVVPSKPREVRARAGAGCSAARGRAAGHMGRLTESQGSYGGGRACHGRGIQTYTCLRLRGIFSVSEYIRSSGLLARQRCLTANAEGRERGGGSRQSQQAEGMQTSLYAGARAGDTHPPPLHRRPHPHAAARGRCAAPLQPADSFLFAWEVSFDWLGRAGEETRRGCWGAGRKDWGAGSCCPRCSHGRLRQHLPAAPGTPMPARLASSYSQLRCVRPPPLLMHPPSMTAVHAAGRARGAQPARGLPRDPARLPAPAGGGPNPLLRQQLPRSGHPPPAAAAGKVQAEAGRTAGEPCAPCPAQESCIFGGCTDTRTTRCACSMLYLFFRPALSAAMCNDMQMIR